MKRELINNNKATQQGNYASPSSADTVLGAIVGPPAPLVFYVVLRVGF